MCVCVCARVCVDVLCVCVSVSDSKSESGCVFKVESKTLGNMWSMSTRRSQK